MQSLPILRIGAGTAAVILVLLGAVWGFGGFAGLGPGGVFALVLGTTFSIGLGIGLMALMFWSDRSERDEHVHHAARREP